MGLSDQAPRSSEAELVAQLLEHLDRRLGDVEQLLRRYLRVGEQPEQAALHERVSRVPAVTCRRRGLDGFGQDPIGPAQVGEPLHCPHAWNELDPARV